MIICVRVRLQQPVVRAPQAVVTLAVMVATTTGARVLPIFVLVFFFRVVDKGRLEIESVRILDGAHIQMIHTKLSQKRIRSN